jgi:hypothetical protein
VAMTGNYRRNSFQANRNERTFFCAHRQSSSNFSRMTVSAFVGSRDMAPFVATAGINVRTAITIHAAHVNIAGRRALHD